MKNKTFIASLNIFVLIFFNSLMAAMEFDFNSSEIILLDNGNKIKGINGVILTTNDGLKITGQQFDYDKINSILNITGNVIVFDDLNKLVLKSEELIYLKNKEIIYTNVKTIIEYDQKYFFEAKNLNFDRNEKKLFSKKKLYIKDLDGNNSSMSNFQFSLVSKLINGDNLEYLDLQSNKIFIKKGIINLTTKEIAGKDPSIKFENSIFGNKINEPRLKANSIYSNNKTSTFNKATFTTCKKNDDCPPWTLSASEIIHDKEKKRISYKDSWLKLYDQPVFYFPKFFHPDPSVKSQSGFMTPTFSESSLTGTSASIPYFNVISNNKDLTFSPIIFSDKSALLQTEYRERNKASEHNIDLSYLAKSENSGKYSSRNHFFSNSVFSIDTNTFDSSKININLQKSAGDNYLKKYKLKSPLFDDKTLLHSIIEFDGLANTSSLNITAEVYEDLTKPKGDRFEYILPSFDFKKNIYPKNFNYGDVTLESSGYKKQSKTSINETSLINNLYLNSDFMITKKGFKNKYVGLIKNVNSDIENSSNNSQEETKLFGTMMYELSYPMKKKLKKYDNLFTPILSFMYSPNQTKDLRDQDIRIDINNIYSIDRLGIDSSVEGGQSVTLGSSFKKIDKFNNDFLTFDLATSFRDTKNEDMPLSSTMGDKQSDYVGNFSLKPNDILALNYNFSYDNNLKYSNFDSLRTSISVNNFFTEFEYLEKNNLLGDESYIANKSTLNLNKDSSLSFSTRKNKTTNLTEYYNLIYEYKNDCLTASMQYKKDFYVDGSIKPEEQLFFTLTIIPFSKTNSPNIN